MKYFTDQGVLLIGKHKEKHYSELPENYVRWAKENIKTFNMEFEWLKYNKPHKPTMRKEQWKSSCGSGLKIANKAFRPPNKNRFQSKATRTAGATLDGSHANSGFKL